jgi:GNAT superfamily N-acetyltransferase
MEIVIRAPKNEIEWEQYYDLRYRVLRQPWNQTRGSERNDGDATGVHFAAYENENLKAIARLDINPENRGQVRFMAVESTIQRKGFGKQVMLAIESYCKTQNISEMILHARETAIPFYESLNFHLVEKSHLLFNEIQHFLMRKQI